METVLFYLAIAALCLWIAIGLELFIGNRAIGFLKDILPAQPPLPKVSIIIPARNEEKNIREALQSVLKQDYGNLEFIIINDRSTDGTGTILAEMQREDSRLHIYEIKVLPSGWLGKNHALQFGAERATGEILLFTDADVIMQPSSISRAVRYLLDKKLDHLAIAPVINMPGYLLGVFTMTFTIFFSLYALPWRVGNKNNRKHIGIGAFNMVRTEVYRAIGMHRPIALRPDDDMKLGKLIKINGYRQAFLHGEGLIQVEWYTSVRELIDGLMKNAFAGVEYSIVMIVASTVFQLSLNVWPFLALFTTGGATWIMNLAIVLIILAACIDAGRPQNLKPWYCIGFPLGTLMFLYILWRAMILNIRNDGINWRGTHYSLAELKANKV